MKNFNVHLMQVGTLVKMKTVQILAESAEEARKIGTTQLKPVDGKQFVGAEPSK